MTMEDTMIQYWYNTQFTVAFGKAIYKYKCGKKSSNSSVQIKHPNSKHNK